MASETSILPARYHDPVRIGQGGMGEIYRAADELLGRTVAVKLLAERYAQEDGVRQRFTREALAAARLSGQPNTITIFDVGEWDGRPYIVMEYLDGGSLEDRLRHGAQDPPQALAWLEQAAAALDAAHAKGVVHRDVKPGNLLLGQDGHVRVADFGVATAVGLDSLTVTGTVLGTAGYLAPEQARGEPAGPAADRYGLGIVAFELLTGSRPFESTSPTAEAAAHVHAPVPAVSERDADLPRELDAVFARALAKDPADRYSSAAEFVAELHDALARAATVTREFAPAAPAPTPASRPRSRSREIAVVGGLLLGALLGGAALAAAFTSDDDRRAAPEVITQVRTQTLQGTTLRDTVTTTVPTTLAEPPPPPAPEPQPPAGGGNGVALTDEATALLRQRRWSEAEAVARQALAALSGGGNRTYLAYAHYNLGRALAEQGKCGEALDHLNRREQMLGAHPDVSAAKRRCGAA